MNPERLNGLFTEFQRLGREHAMTALEMATVCTSVVVCSCSLMASNVEEAEAMLRALPDDMLRILHENRAGIDATRSDGGLEPWPC